MRKDEIRKLRWQQVDFKRRHLVVGHCKTEAGTGRLIPLNVAAFDALVEWARQFANAEAEHHVFPFCENRHIDPARPTKRWPVRS
jgi:integrase